MENVKIGDEVYYTNLAEFRMADGTNQVECRIMKVRITWTFNNLKEPTRYLFVYENAQLNATADQLSANEEDAVIYAKWKIEGIAIVIKEEEVKEVEEDKS